FGLGAYAMGMHLMLEIGTQSVYQNALPDFMVWNQVKTLPLFWRPFHSAIFTIVAIMAVPALVGFAFGFLAFRSRIRGVYFSIITQALALSAWLVFNRNEMNLGGTNGLADFKTIFGFPLSQPATQRGLYVVTALVLIAGYVLCRWITATRAGKVLVAIRDSETRVLFSGYSPAAYKLFAFVRAADPGGEHHLHGRRHGELRRLQGAEPTELLHGPPRAARRHRPQRRRQDDPARCRLGPREAGERPRDLRPQHGPPAAPREPDCPARDRPQVPDAVRLRQPDGLGQRRALAAAGLAARGRGG